MSFQIGNVDLGVGFKGDISDLQRKFGQAGTEVEKFGRKTRTEMTGAAGESDRLESSVGRLGSAIKGALIGGSVAGGLLLLKNGVMAATSAVVEAQVQVDRLRNGFNFGAGSVEGGARELAFVREEANRLGLDLNSAAGEYMKFVAASRGSAMQGQQTRDVFRAIAEATTVMGLGAEQSERAFTAVVQMMSKGKVMAEELRGQLGEHLPGAFSIAARAMNVSEVELNKLMETGSVFSADFLPRFAAQLRKELAGSVSESTLSMQANLNRLSTSWTQFKQQFAQSGAGSAVSGEIQGIAYELQVLGETMEKGRHRNDGFWSTLVNTTGVAAGRAGFGALEFAFNSTNRAVNFLSGGLLDFNTQLDLTPDGLKTNAVQLELTAQKLREAEVRYEALRKQYAMTPENAWLKHDLIRMREYIEALKEAQDEQRKFAGLNSGSVAVGSVGSGDTAVLRAQAAIRARQQAALGDFKDKYATPEEKLSTEIAKQKALLGDLYTPELEKRLREHFIKPNREAAAELKKKAKAVEEARRTEAEFLALVSKAEIRWSEQEQESITKSINAWADFVEARQNARDEALAAVNVQRLENEEIGLSADALSHLQAARLRDAAASLRRRAALMDNVDLSRESGDALRQEAAAYDDLAAAKLQGRDRQRTAELREKEEQEALQRRETLATSIREGIMDGARQGLDVMEIFRRELMARFADTILTPAIKPVAEGFDRMLGEGFKWLSGAFGAGGTVNLGTVTGADLSAAFHSGGIVGGTPTFSRYVDPGVFAGAPRMHTGGIAGDEVPIIAQRGEGVFTQEQMRNLAPAGAQQLTVRLVNQSGTPLQAVSQRQSVGADGSMQVEVLLDSVDAALADRISVGSGATSRALESRFGLRPAIG